MHVKLGLLAIAVAIVTSCGISKSEKKTPPVNETICTVLVDSKIDESYQTNHDKSALGSDPLKFSVHLRSTETTYALGFRLNNLEGAEDTLDLGDEFIVQWPSVFPQSALKDFNTLTISFVENNVHYPLWTGQCKMQESIKTSSVSEGS